MAYAEVTDDLSRINVETVWAEKELIRQVPGAKWDPNLKTWHVATGWAACQVLRGVFGPSLVLGPNLVNWAVNERGMRIDPANALRDAVSSPLGAHDPRLFAHQRATVDFGLAAGNVLNCNEMGVGKTAETLSTMAERPDSLPALVVCPNSVKSSWAREIGTWLPNAVPYVLTGGAVKRRKTLELAAEDPFAVVIINLEAVRLHSRLGAYGSVRLRRCAECGGSEDVKTTSCEVHERELNVIPFRTVVVDEAHRLKDPKAKWTRACWSVGSGPSVKYRFALTGTPIANHVGDLWSVLHFLSPTEFPSKTRFIDRYAMMSWNRFGGLDISGIRPDTHDELFRILNPRLRRVLKSIVLPDLPPKVRTVRQAEMSTKQAKAYHEFADKLLTKLDSGEYVLATNSLTASLRLLQFSSAYASVDEDGQVTLCDPSSKLDVMMEILEELGDRQVVVAAESRQLIELAITRLEAAGISYRAITGSVPDQLRTNGLADFQAGRARVMLFTIKAGGVGLTMTAADTIIFLQRSWSLVENMQAEDRVHRIGAEGHESIQVIDLVAPGTVEIDQIQRLHIKAQRLDEIVRDRAALAAHGDAQALAKLDAEEAALSTESLGGS